MKTETVKKQKTFKGVVVSDKMDKTIVVAVSTFKKDPKYKKYYKITKKYKAHDEQNSSKVGENVVIAEVRPISKDKRFALVTK